tara:strand:+ start:614 stop:802 length:189 start_codon:yes stop_codon:yes gene_type:complete
VSIFKVGDLVADTDPDYKGELGIVVKIDHGEGMYKVRFNNGSEWLTEMFLELISEAIYTDSY